MSSRSGRRHRGRSRNWDPAAVRRGQARRMEEADEMRYQSAAQEQERERYWRQKELAEEARRNKDLPDMAGWIRGLLEQLRKAGR